MELFQSLSLDIQLHILSNEINLSLGMHGYGELYLVVGTIYKPDRVYRVSSPLSRVHGSKLTVNLGTLKLWVKEQPKK